MAEGDGEREGRREGEEEEEEREREEHRADNVTSCLIDKCIVDWHLVSQKCSEPKLMTMERNRISTHTHFASVFGIN